MRRGLWACRADLQTDHPVDVVALGRDHQDRCVTGRAQAATDRQPVLARHHDVQQHQVHPAAGGQAIESNGVGTAHGLVALAAQQRDLRRGDPEDPFDWAQLVARMRVFAPRMDDAAAGRIAHWCEGWTDASADERACLPPAALFAAA